MWRKSASTSNIRRVDGVEFVDPGDYPISHEDGFRLPDISGESREQASLDDREVAKLGARLNLLPQLFLAETVTRIAGSALSPTRALQPEILHRETSKFYQNPELVGLIHRLQVGGADVLLLI